jgi:hypothetical protein
MLLAVAEDLQSPLMLRDVHHLDCQDDGAATCLVSTCLLKYLRDYRPDWVGLGVHLFVIGRLFKAWQNWTMTHCD